MIQELPHSRVQPSTSRVLSPSHVEVSEPVNYQPKEVEMPLGKTWPFRTDLLIPNGAWVIIHLAIASAIVVTAITITVSRCRQVNEDIITTTLQSGSFIGEACSASSDCIINAQCYSSVCQCSPDFYLDQTVGQCLYMKTYGVSCVDSSECNVNKHLGCYDDMCACPINMIWANYYGSYECVRVRQVGQTCQSSSHCIPTSYCAYDSAQTDYVCSCPNSYYFNGYTSQCQLIRKVNEQCTGYFQECPSNTVCRGTTDNPNDKYCFCIQGYYYRFSSQSCVAQIAIGNKCVNQTDCQDVGLVCYSYTCQCTGNLWRWNGTYCNTYYPYGQSCYNLTSCNYLLDTNMACAAPTNGATSSTTTVCGCSSGYYFDEYTSRCTLKKWPGIPCVMNYECIDYAYCSADPYSTSKSCTCVPGYYYDNSQSTTSCIIQYPRSSATYGVGCYNRPTRCSALLGTYCDASSGCICKYGYYWGGTECQLSGTSGDSCLSSTSNTCRSYQGLSCSYVSGSYSCQCSTGKTYNETYYYCV